MLSIQTNVNSMVAQENLRVNSDFQGQTITRLTSGYRINSSADDAAGLGVANKYRSDVAELMQGVRNANDGLSTLQIIDGGLNNISKILDRLKTLATQSASSTFTGNRVTLQNEFSSLMGEIDRQAANIGLNSSGSGNAKQIEVYVGGGGTNMSNSKVGVNLSTGADVVTSAGLGLTGSNLNATTQTPYSYTAGSGFTTVAGGTQRITVTIDGVSDYIDLADTTTVGAARTAFNAKFSAVGVTADASMVLSHASKTFTVAASTQSGTLTGGLNGGATVTPTGATAGTPVAVAPEVGAQSAITAITNAVGKLGAVQGKVGTGQNQLQYAIQLAQSQITSFSAAESRIRDADVAQEAANLTKGQVLQQASLAALAQANSAPQSVLSLLRG